MTESGRLKRAVREHMARTGKSYGQARRDLLKAREHGEQAKVTWALLAELEPRLLELEATVQSLADNENESWFCANRAWLNGGLKRVLVELVGWERGDIQVESNAGRPRSPVISMNVTEIVSQYEVLEPLRQQRKEREHAAGLGVLWTSQAYSVAYAHLYDGLPACRACDCIPVDDQGRPWV